MDTPYQRLDSDSEDPLLDSKPRFQHTNSRFRRVDETVKWLYGAALGIWVVASVIHVIHVFTVFVGVDSCMPSTQGRRLFSWYSKGDSSTTLRLVIVSIAAVITVGAASVWLAKMFLRCCLRAPGKVVKSGALGLLILFALIPLGRLITISGGGAQSQTVGVSMVSSGVAFLVVFVIIYAGAWRKLDFVASMVGTAAACVCDNNAIIHIGLVTLLIATLIAAKEVSHWVGCNPDDARSSQSHAIGIALAVCKGPFQTLLSFVAIGFWAVPLKVNPYVTDADKGLCRDASGQQVACCVSDPDHNPTVTYLLFYSGLFLFFWTVIIISAVRVYAIGTLVHKWYFAAPGSPMIGIGQLCKSLWDNSGCIMVGGAVVAVTSFVRVLTRRRCLRSIDVLISWLTKYALLYAAMTGQPFLDAASDSTSLLARNLLDGVRVMALPARILSVHALVMSIVMGVVASGLASVVAILLALDVEQMAVAVGVGSFAWTFVLMIFMVGILVNTTDAAFICFAMDKDADQVTRPEVHASLATLQAPSGVLVEQPTGDLAYAPQQQRSVEMQR